MIIDKDSGMGPINFLKLIVKFWKIVNIMGAGADNKFNDPLRPIARSTCDHRLEFLLKLADTADGMTNSGNKGIQQLTGDTGHAISNVCRGLVDLIRYLFECGSLCVILE